MGLTEEELPDIVNRWRQANRHIVALWAAVEDAAITATTEGQTTHAGRVCIRQEHDGELRFLTIELPSKRKLYCPQPFISKKQV